MQYECNEVWIDRKQKNKQKVQFLLDKKKQSELVEDTVTDIRGVKYRDIDLQTEVNDKNQNAVVYGNVEVSENMAEVLKMNPKLMTYEKIDETDMEIEFE